MRQQHILFGIRVYGMEQLFYKKYLDFILYTKIGWNIKTIKFEESSWNLLVNKINKFLF